MERVGDLGHRRRWALLPPPVHARTKPHPGSHLTIIVTGASGTLGRRVVTELERRGLAHRRSGRDLEALRLTDVSAVIVCATDGRRPREVDLAQVEFFARRELHVVYPSIVGCDVMPWPYYDVKVECETRLLNVPHTIVRATQYHQLIWGWYTAGSRRPWLIVPAKTRYQVLDPAVHAAALVDAAVGPPQGRTPDIGGRVAYEAKDLARSSQRAAAIRRLIIPFNRRGILGAALRAGANLTPNRVADGESWNEFVERASGFPRTRS